MLPGRKRKDLGEVSEEARNALRFVDLDDVETAGATALRAS